MHIIEVKKLRGFSLIEVMIFLSIFVFTVLTFFQSFNVGTTYIIENKKKLQAVELANERIEKLRNLGYENLTAGTTEDEVVGRNGVTYQVTTRITEFDDPGDGEVPSDTISWDYLKVGMEVKWDATNENKKVNLSAIIVPPVREEDADKGYMRLHVIDQNGDGLPAAEVEVTNLDSNAVVYAGTVNASGNLFLTGLDPDEHKITVEGSGGNYSVSTMDATGTFEPWDRHADIEGKLLTEKYIQTDKISNLNILLKDSFGSALSGLGFDIEGGKFLGWENTTTLVYDFSDSIADSDGTESFSNLSYGPYFFEFTDLNNGSDDYVFLWMTPLSDQENEAFLDADSTLEATAVLAPESEPSLLVTVLDSLDNAPIYDAYVRLQFSGEPAYDTELRTNEFGKVYFPETIGQMINDDYQLTVTASGYTDDNRTVTINGLTAETVSLNTP